MGSAVAIVTQGAPSALEKSVSIWESPEAIFYFHSHRMRTANLFESKKASHNLQVIMSRELDN